MTTIQNQETQVSSNGQNPAIIRLTNANFVIAYQKNSNIAAKIFNSDGIQIKDEFITVQGCLSSQYPTFAIASISVGGFALACISGGLASLHVSLWNNNGTPQYKDLFPYNPSPANPHSSLELSSLSMVGLNNGNFVLAWSCREDNSQAVVYTYTYNSKGDSISSSTVKSYLIDSVRPYKDFFKADVIHADSPHTHIGQMNSKDIIIAYKYKGDVFTTFYDEGKYSADRFALALTSHDTQYIIASETKYSDQNWRIFIQYRDTGLNHNFQYVSSNLDYNINPAITTLNNGYTAVTWHSYNAIDNLSKGIFLQIYDVMLHAKFDEPIKINSIDLNDKFDINNYNTPSIASIDQGFVITWQGNTDAGNSIYFIKFDNEGNKINPLTSLGSIQDNISAEESYSITHMIAGVLTISSLIALLGYALRTYKFGDIFHNHELDHISKIGMTSYGAVNQADDLSL